jgi:hypothetical protein
MSQEQVQLAEIRLVRLRQELEQKYGHYDQLRRTATGILQAIDLSLVRSSVIQSVTEELMVTSPKYWLAPALVALTGWVNDQQALAERALEEAIRRNPKKTSLFFALVSRRYGRQEACRQWFDQYYREVNPMKIDRDMVMVLDGITNGVFPLSIRTDFMEQCQKWIDKLSSDVELKANEHDQWRDALFQRVEYPVVEEKYPYLSENSSTWDKVGYSAQIVQYHESIGNYINDVLKQDVTPAAHVEEAVDDLLEKLVFQYEDGELGLRQEERMVQILIETQGDQKLAEKQMAGEKELFSEHQNFLELLRNMAMYPETLKVSPLSQRFALAVSKELVIETHHDLTLSIRKQVPVEVEVICPRKIQELDVMQDWSFLTRDGDNVAECEQSLDSAVKKANKQLIKEMWKVRFSKDYLKQKKAKAIIGALLFTSLVLYTPLFGSLALVASGFLYKWIREKDFHDQAKTIDQYVKTELQATLADVVDYRQTFQQQDEKSQQLPDLLKPLHVEEMIKRNYDKTRVVVH